MLRRCPSEALPLSVLILLYKGADNSAWWLANSGKALLDLLVLKTCQGTDEGRAKTPAPLSGRHQSFDRNVGHRIGYAESVEDDIHTQGNDTDDRDDYNDDHVDDTIFVDDEVVSALSLVPNPHPQWGRS